MIRGVLFLFLYAGMIVPSFAAFMQGGNHAGAWQSQDGIILVLTCFKRLEDTDQKCGSANELKILLINKSNLANGVNVTCYRLDGDMANAIASLSIRLEPLAHAEYSFKSEKKGTAPTGFCHLMHPSQKMPETTASWVKLK